MSKKYSFQTAYVGFMVLGSVLSLVLSSLVAFVVGPSSAQLVALILTVVVSFYLFRFVILRNVLPYVSQGTLSVTTSDQQPGIVQE